MSVRFSEGSLAPAHFLETPDDFADLPFPLPTGGLNACGKRRNDCRCSRPLIAGSVLHPARVLRCPVCHTGLKEFYLDLHDNPQAIADAAVRVNAS